MAKAKKKGATLFKVVSTEGTGFFYLVCRNLKNKQEKYSFRKYDPVVRKHVLFKEAKLNK
ncbi:50S ribosomal protein L33 [Neorickettsia sennetsu]|uniref:Large ribosomal subunit protein bL33 n=1 Tax=Ehrlichia sennetsu (strain ATCC VR-367 / Miyayama) TaxID=222891 RepID=RL33_EHRS3|nr:50S ribosomal protein L33 [Neorickettsia sennetsu]Q2GEE6.1 RecName: Full=Large ribosomal subunit protein bL33; AltName: Full=50S ribosomal protein L33 [Neorickettsia sennetsu str. Miyayama]ABD45980.1 ribosomal protein L33 [Neorickettsia sennetsu str. Miyayama]